MLNTEINKTVFINIMIKLENTLTHIIEVPTTQKVRHTTKRFKTEDEADENLQNTIHDNHVQYNNTNKYCYV